MKWIFLQRVWLSLLINYHHFRSRYIERNIMQLCKNVINAYNCTSILDGSHFLQHVTEIVIYTMSGESAFLPWVQKFVARANGERDRSNQERRINLLMKKKRSVIEGRSEDWGAYGGKEQRLFGSWIDIFVTRNSFVAGGPNEGDWNRKCCKSSEERKWIRVPADEKRIADRWL